MKYRILALLIALLLCLTACGEPAPQETAQTTEAAQTTRTAETAEPVEEEPSKLDTALTFVDKPVAELTAAIGEPTESRYETSCSGPGDDGVLQYDGFIVFTYREPDGSAETVVDAEAE